MSFGQAFDPKRNNLNMIRLVLAIVVIFSHSYSLIWGLELGEQREPLRVLTWHGALNVGGLAVDGFFAISGFLLAGSWLAGRDGSLGFAIRRALRIYPAFLVCVLVCIAVVGPLGVHDVSAYFADPRAYRLMQYLYFGRFWNSLPGCFSSNPMPEIINGSLWTIKYEVACYAVLFALGITGLLRGTVVLVMTVLVCVLLNVLALTGRSLPYAMDPSYMPRLLTFFLGGATLYLWRTRVPYHFGLFFVALTLSIVTVRLPIWATAILPTAGVYCLFYLACLPSRLNRIGRKHDLSYGVYLYAWPIQQLLVHYGLERQSPLRLTLLTVPVALAAGASSWFLVEGPALRLKRGLPRSGETIQSSKVETVSSGLDPVAVEGSPVAPGPTSA